MGLPLHLIRRTDAHPNYRPTGDWISCMAVLVAAHDRGEARRLASEVAGEEGAEVWLDGMKTRVWIIGESTYKRPRVVMVDKRG